MKLTSPLLTGAMCLALAAGAFAADKSKQVELPVGLTGSTASSAPTNDGNLEEIKQRINKTLQGAKPDLSVSDVQKSSIPGVYKVSLGQGPAIYTNGDGSSFIVGDFYRIKGAEVVNVSDEERNGMRAKAVAEIKKEDMIIFSPQGKPKASIFVFTDIDCGYCQMLHKNVGKMNELGIEVRYLGYPRAGINSESFNKLASAWCAADKKAALTKLKNREEVPNNVCPNNPIASQFQLGQQLGVSGTPALVFENGQMVPGFVEPERLAQMLNIKG
jgi:thiol:disulfide interchange protein DsbC